MTTRNPPFSGVIPPVVTPLTNDGDIDVASLEKLVAFLLDGGVNGLFALGSSGETAYLTDRQRGQVLDVLTGAAAGQVPVLAGVIDTATNRVIERAHTAREKGVDAIVATAPFYARTHKPEINAHFRAVAQAVELPLLAYDVPVCVQSKLAADMVLELAEDGVLAGVKDSSGDDANFRALTIGAARFPEFAVLTGHELVVDGMLLGGADGSVPGLGNVDPHGYQRLTAAAAAQDWAGAQVEQDRLASLFDIVSAPRGVSAGAAGVGAFKTALQLRGVLASNTVSAPMRALNADESARIATFLRRAGLL